MANDEIARQDLLDVSDHSYTHCSRSWGVSQYRDLDCAQAGYAAASIGTTFSEGDEISCKSPTLQNPSRKDPLKWVQNGYSLERRPELKRELSSKRSRASVPSQITGRTMKYN
jgi:hypothetical protein